MEHYEISIFSYYLIYIYSNYLTSIYSLRVSMTRRYCVMFSNDCVMFARD